MKKLFSIVILSLTIMCGAIFAGCGPSYSSLSLSFSSEKIEMLRTDESESYSITVENYFDFDAQFSFSFEKPIAVIVENSVKYVGDGVFTFSIAPLIAGETDLCITLRGTGKQIYVPVYIKEDITGFDPVENIFALRGKSLFLDESLFTFTPANTTEKAFTYELTEQYTEIDGLYVQNNTLFVEDNISTREIDKVDILVTNISKPELFKTISIKLVNEVDVSTLSVDSYGLSEDENGNKFFNSEKITNLISEGISSENIIEIIVNKELEFQKQINVQFEKWDEYLVEVYTKDEIDGDISKINPIENQNENFAFAVQVGEIGEYSLFIKVYQSNFKLNYKEFEIKINATSTPTSIKINGQNSIGLVEFYTFGSEARDFNFSVFPESALKGTNFTYNIELYSYSGNAYPTVIEESDTNFTKQTALPTDYLQISYNNQKLTKLNDILGLTDLSYLTLMPIGAYEHSFAFKITCLNGTEELCSNVMYVKIYVGATEFGLNSSIYVDNTIYVDVAESVVLFNDFIYTEGSTIGYLTIMQKNLEESVCDIEQLNYDEDITKPTLKIVPKKVGTTEYTIITPNGIPAKLKVVVVRLIQESDFTITLSNENSNNVSSFETYSNGSLLSVVIKGNVEKEQVVGIAYTEAKILNYFDANAYSYSYEVLYEGSNYEIINNKIIKAKAFTEPETIIVKTQIAKIENFILSYETFNHEFSVSCIQYIKKLSITTNNSLDETNNRVKFVSVYDKNVLSYKNQNMAEAYIYMDLEYSGELVHNSELISLKSWSIMNLSYDEDQDEEAKANKVNTYFATVGSIGQFYPNYNEGAEYVGKFVCDIEGINSITSFTIALTILDQNTQQEFTDQITITIEKYIDVDSIWLKTGTDNIYLDNTAENRTKSISVYVMPVNATFQEIAISVQTMYTNCIDWQYASGVITFTFVSAGNGNIYIYPVSKMKVSNEIPEYNICLPFVCADGTSEDKALKISTYEDLISIQTDRHYYLDSIIDCGEKELHIKQFNGSLRGTFLPKADERFINVEQVGGITNFVVADNKTGNYGLFGEIGKNAIIYNLEIKGIFKNSQNNEAYVFNLTNTTNIGLLTGINYGTILNVSVGISKQNTLYIKSEKSDIDINVGIVAGLNSGNIIVDKNAKNSTLFASNTKDYEFVSQISGQYKDANFGAVAGINGDVGVVENINGIYGSNETEAEEEFISLGLYGVNINIFAKLYDYENVGGAVGHNIGKIANCKVLGEVLRLKYEETSIADSNVGGLIGIQSGVNSVENNHVRIFVRGTGIVSGLIGKVITSNIESIKNNKVQAIDTGKIGSSASMVIGIGSSVKVYEISEKLELANNNKAESYVQREKVNETFTSDTLNVDKYYGDMIVVSGLDSWATIYESYEFIDGVDDADFSDAIEYFALAIFKRAQNDVEQNLIKNEILTKDILNISKIMAKEVNISVNNIAVASTVNYGKQINLFNTGLVKIKITSALNYKNNFDLAIYFTNYYDNINLYLNKDKTQLASHLELYNNNTSSLYFDCYANEYNYKNQQIKLLGNNEIEFAFSENDNLNINASKQALYVNSINNVEGVESIYIYPALKIDGMPYYQYNVTCGENGYKIFIKDGYSIIENNEEKQTIIVDTKIITGIDTIRLSKNYVMAEPTDTITFDVVYTTFNDEDKFVPILTIGNKKYTLNNNGYFVDSMGDNVFKLTKQSEDILIGENKYQVTYSLSMVISSKVYEMFRFEQKTIILEFFANKTNAYNLIEIEYSPETISSVLVNNYSYEENNEMIITTENNTLKFEENNAVKSSAYSSTGDINILSAYVFTNLSEFNYVDIVMDAGQPGGYLAYVDKDGNISKYGIITSIGNTTTLRLFKEDLITRDEMFVNNIARALKINVMYSLPQTMTDQNYVPIAFKFYDKNNTLCYIKDVTVISKAARQVSFNIYGKTQYAGAYSVARGMTYALETTIVGYNDSEVRFEVSDPSVASIEKISDIYYLKITTSELPYVNNIADGGSYKITIKSYGVKQTNTSSLKSREQITHLNIYEVCLDEENAFSDDKVDIKVLQTTDIRDLIISKLNLEGNNNIVYSKINEVKNNIKNNATYTVIAGDKEIVLNGDSFNNSITNLDIDGYKLLAKAMIDNLEIKVRIDFKFKYISGVPTISADGIKCSKTFNLTSYLGTTEDVPQPIFTYKDLLNVKSGENYRLVEDIIIKPDEFNMITTTPNSFDGNGHTIYIENGQIKAENLSSFAIFETISQNATFKNINIVIKNNLTLNLDNSYSTMGINAGILASRNYGVITNCCVQSDSVIFVNILGTVAVSESSSFGTLCAINSGYITNCQILANITVNGSSMGGLVAKNEISGHIASSYVKKSRILNTTSVTGEKIITAGICAVNYGEIAYSFIEGVFSDKMYCTYEKDNHGLGSKIIYTSTLTAGFVYENYGKISDSYSNIPIVSSSRCSGFIGINKEGAVVERTYSLSQLKRNDTMNYGFVIGYELNSVFKDCFFVIENGFINAYTAESNYNYNNGIYSEKIKGVKPLGISDFNIYNSNGTIKENTPFKNFIISDKDNVRAGIWFAVSDKAKESEYMFDRAYLCSVQQLSIYDKSTNKFISQEFSSRRLQLVSPNFIAYSKMEIKESEGEYEYYCDEPTLNEGSEYNPYLIANATKLEEYLKNSRKYEYFRLIKDVDYLEDNIYSSNVYGKNIVGYIEGNNLSISNYAINSKISANYAGFMSQFGNNSRSQSVMKNVTFKPTYINLPNSITVGAVAGNLVNSSVYNVSIDGKDLVVTGNNVVGGMFGETSGVNNIVNISSNVTAKASKYNASLELKKNEVESLIRDITFSTISGNRNVLSYAGSLIGYISGQTNITNPQVGENAKSYAIISGLLFGGIGELATVSDITLELNSFNNQIKAFAFGGIVSGEVRGSIQNVEVNSNILTKDLFSCYPITPIAIGGISGLVNGGLINNVKSEEGYSVIGTAFTGNYTTHESGYVVDKVKNPYIAKYVGGIAGYLRGTTTNKTSISNIDIKNLIIAGGNVVGGIIGFANNSSLIVKLDNISLDLTGHKSYINADNEEVSELVYTMYVSEVISENLPGYDFNSTIRFGYAIGCLSYNDENAQDTLGNFTVTVDGFTVDKKDSQTGLYYYYMTYNNLAVKHELNLNVGSLSSSLKFEHKYVLEEKSLIK